MRLLRKTLLAVALLTGMTGSTTIAPPVAHAAIFEWLGGSFSTFSEAESFRTKNHPSTAFGPTFVPKSSKVTVSLSCIANSLRINASYK